MADDSISRRSFLTKTGAAATYLTVVPSIVLGRKVGKTAPSDKLNIAVAGIGGRGYKLTNHMQSENIVALCDIDWKYSEKCFNAFPKAKRYFDWRKMLDENAKLIDAVIVATPDHTHAIIAAHAITLGKHVYCETPLTHSVYESRLLTALSEKYQIATQMGNQGSSEEGVRKICEWIWNGEIGDVLKVDAFTDRPLWGQGLSRPGQSMMVPGTLNWDLFTGPAALRPYHEIYTPLTWRAWWDFGTGAFGDRAGHVLHPVYKALKLNAPTRIQGSSTSLLKDNAPNAQIIRMVFPEREPEARVKFPEVELTWQDGGLQPMKPQNWPAGRDMNVAGGGVLFHGTKDTLVCGCYGKDPWLLSGRVPDVLKILPRVPNENHEMDWIRACKESPENRMATSSSFIDAGPFSETIALGVISVRLQSLHRELLWDKENMLFTNIGDEIIHFYEQVSYSSKPWKTGLDKKVSHIVNARQFAGELIKHSYRKGWALPEMPG
jgi:hypothetical protein